MTIGQQLLTRLNEQYLRQSILDRKHEPFVVCSVRLTEGANGIVWVVFSECPDVPSGRRIFLQLSDPLPQIVRREDVAI